MLGDLFGNQEEEAIDAGEAQKSTFYKSKIFSLTFVTAKPANCAGDLELPPQTRNPINLVGLQNQGATCYLNSLFQTLFMTVEFRQAIFNLPLCEKTIDNQLAFGKGKKAQKMLFEIQRMFVMLQEADTRTWSTKDLTLSFGWEGAQGSEQQDIHDLNRVLVEAIEAALSGTMYESLIRELYFGSQNTVIMCMECGEGRRRSEQFMYLQIDVKGLKGVKQSLDKMFQFETFDGDSKLECEKCQAKTTSQRGLRLSRLPPILQLNLSRIELDYATWQRKKINDRFEYPLELDLSPYVDAEVQSTLQPEESFYDLKSIVIHSGGPYGGHYHAFIKDDLGLGVWDLKLPETFTAEPKIVAEPKKEEIKPVEAEKVVQKKKQKGKNNQPNKNQPKEQKKNNNPKNPEAKLDFDLCDFPIPYSSKNLVQNWFDFNDSTVRAIMPGTLQSMFGGNSASSAYMLVYRQKKPHPQKPEIPDYWVPALKAMKEQEEQERQHYNEMKNQLDIIVQERHQVFDITDSDFPFVSYIKDKDFEQQGITIRLKFTDTIDEARSKIATSVGLDADQVRLIEVQRLQNSYCQLLNPWDDFSGSQLIKDTKVTHLSCWMLIIEPSLSFRLNLLTKDDALPMRIRVTHAGTDFITDVYSNMTLTDFKSKISTETKVDAAQMKLEVMEDTQIRRIDTQVYDKEFLSLPEELRRKMTLRDLKIVHNSLVHVTIKGPNEVDESEVNQKVQNKQLVVNVDDTLDIRTVIANTELDKQVFERFQVKLDWTISKLADFLADKLGLQGEHRLRNLKDNRLFMKEEMQSLLGHYETFQEGGARIQIEKGRPTTMAEVSVNVCILGKEEDVRQFYFNVEASVQECKDAMCSVFGIEQCFTLYRVDAFLEPTYALRRLKIPLVKLKVSSGDLLVLKSDKQLLPDEKLKLSLHMTTSGMSNDSQYMQDIEISKEFTLNELKEILMDLRPEIASAPSVDHIRLREKSGNMFFGKILREPTKTLKQLQIKNHTAIVVQVLKEPELLTDPNTYVLLYSVRDANARTYTQTREVKFQGTKLSDLQSHLQQEFAATLDFKVLKHVPHAFEWKIIDPDSIVTEKKKKTTVSYKLSELKDLKMQPIMLKDGDHFAIAMSNSVQDDFQTDHDSIAREEFRVMKEAERIAKELNPGNKKKNQDSASVTIDIND